MRALPRKWSNRFDAVLNLGTSFGFFTRPTDDLDVVREFARVLRPGGKLIWHGGSRDGLMARFLPKDWWITRDGTAVMQQRSFDPLSGVLTVHSTIRPTRGKQLEREHRIRVYSASSLAQLLKEAGLVVEQVFEGWKARPLGRTSTEMLVVARSFD